MTIKKKNRNTSELRILIPVEEEYKITDISFNDFQSCTCFDRICDNKCGIRIDSELGAGVGGTVSKVYNLKNGCTWAKKVLAKNVSCNEDMTRLLFEIENIKKCDSRYVISTYGATYFNNQISCFMEYMDIGSLDVILYEINRVPERIMSRIVRNVTKGLEYLYTECDITHKDVKPSNILLNKNGYIKLCDFGISVAPIRDSRSATISPGTNKQYFGTPAYMAPERLRNEKVFHRSQEQKGDIWSLGITILELAIGNYPLPMPTEQELEYLLRNDPYGELKRFPMRKRMQDFSIPILQLISYFNDATPNLPPKLFTSSTIDFIDICLQKDPEKRQDYERLLKHSFLYLDTFDDSHSEFYRWLNCIQNNFTYKN